MVFSQSFSFPHCCTTHVLTWGKVTRGKRKRLGFPLLWTKFLCLPNLYVEPKSPMWWYLEVQPWEVIGSPGWSFHWITTLKRALIYHVKRQWENCHLQTRRRPSPVSGSARNLILGFPAFRTVENVYYLSNLLQQPGQTKKPLHTMHSRGPFAQLCYPERLISLRLVFLLHRNMVLWLGLTWGQGQKEKEVPSAYPPPYPVHTW